MSEKVFEDGYKVYEIKKEIEKDVVEFFILSQEFFKKSNSVTKEQRDLGIGYNLQKDQKECIQIRYGTPMIYPETCEKSFIDASKVIFSHLDDFARQILKELFYEKNKDVYENILESLDPLVDKIDKDGKYLSSSVLDVCHYFKESKNLFCPSHTDQGLITLAIELDNVALQVYKPRKESNYTFCLPESTKGNTGKCILMFGEQMGILSKRKIKPTVHRVKNLDCDRFSLIFKLRARPDILGPMTESDYPILSLQKSLSQFHIKNTKTINQEIPVDILTQISFFLPLKEILKLGLVCQEWYKVCNGNGLWRMLAISHFHVIGMNIVSWKKVYIEKYLQTNKLDSSKHFVKVSKVSGESQSVKLVVVGDVAVGKTCMLLAFASNAFPEDYVPTVFDEYSCNMMLDNFTINLSLWDTAGQKEYDQLRPLSYPDTSIFVIMFSVGSRSSMKNIETKWLPELNQFCPGVPFIIVGAQTDLRKDYANNGKDFVTTEEGMEFAQKTKAFGYFEVSAKKLQGLQEVFHFACRSVSSKISSLDCKDQKKNNCLIN